jgi:prephenate dehydrogenase
MPVQITIIGLGKIGASIGLALAAHKESVLRVGHDKEMSVERAALQKGAVDKTIHNLPNAVSEARLLVLAIPASYVRETLEFIVPDLKADTLILDTSPIKAEAAKWVKELLPACHYVGLSPAINPELLHDFSIGVEAARANLFTNAPCFIAAASGVPEEAANLAVDFVKLLGAHPVLTDVAEADGLTAATHIMPQLVSAALLNATLDQPGWVEARKLASRVYATVTSGVEYQDEINSLKTSAMQNRAVVVHALDVMIAALYGLRDDIDKQDGDGVAVRLESALKGRQRWMGERTKADWNTMPKAEAEDMGSFFGRLFGTGMFKKREKK